MARTILVAFAGGLLPLFLFGFGLVFSAYQVLGSSDSVKNALTESGIYQTAGDNLTALAQKDTHLEGQSQSAQTETREAIKRAFPASSLQSQTENVLDSTYAWIQGRSKDLEIKIDITSNKDSLLNEITTRAKARAASLPVCPPSTVPDPTLDVFSASCLPRGVTPDAAATAARERLEESGFFKEAVVNVGNTRDASGQTLQERLSAVPVWYDRAVTALYVSGVAIIVLLIVLILLSRPVQDGVKRAATLLLSIGASTVILALVSIWLVQKFAATYAETLGTAPSFVSSIANALRLLASDFRAWWLGYGILLVILSIGLFIWLRVWREKSAIEKQNATPSDQRPTIVIN